MAPNWQFYFAAKVLMSIAAFWTVAEWVTLMDSMPVGKRGLGYALFSTIIGLVGLASPYIGGWIFDTYHVQGMRLVLFSVAAADVTKALLYTRGLRETLKPRKKEKAVTLGFRSVFSLVARSFAEALKTLKWMPPSLLGFCALNVVYWFAWSLAGPFFVFYALEVVSLTKVEWGIISMIELAISLCLRFPGGRLADRYSKRRAVLISCAIEVPLFIGFIYSRRYLQVLAVFVLSTAFETLTGPAWDALQTDLMPRDRRGKVLSLFRIMGAFSGLFGSLLGGYLYTLNAALPFWVYVFLAIVGTSIAFMVIHEPKKPEA